MVGKLPPRTIVRTTVSEQTYEDIKERIIDGTLAPGTRLNIDAVARELKVSSTPIREALARLEREQLVLLELYAGYSVAPPPDPAYLKALLEFRMLWEGECAMIGAPRKAPQTMHIMEQSYKRMRATRRLGAKFREYRKFTDDDSVFHQAIIDSAGNPAMTKIYAGLKIIMLQARLYLTRSPTGAPSEEVLSEHHNILTAFQIGNGNAAKLAVINHLEGGKRRLEQAVQSKANVALVTTS